MNSKIIGIIAAIVIVGLGAWYFTQNNNSGEVQNDSMMANDQTELAIENTSLKELMTRGQDIQCSWEDTTDQSSGTIYVSKDKARGDFTVIDENQTKIGHMILVSNTSHIWMDGDSRGFKVSLQNNTEADTSSSQGVDPNKDYNYSCSSWEADNSLFELPADVNFQEFNIPAMPASSASGETQMDINPTAICNTLSEPAKSQCLSNIKQ